MLITGNCHTFVTTMFYSRCVTESDTNLNWERQVENHGFGFKRLLQIGGRCEGDDCERVNSMGEAWKVPLELEWCTTPKDSTSFKGGT